MTTVDFHPDDEAVESAQDYLSLYVRCRLRGHLWDDDWFNASVVVPHIHGGVRFDARCERCGEERIEVRLRSHLRVVLYRRYLYPAHYKLSGDVTRDNLWDEYLIRREDGQLGITRVPRELAAVS